MRRNNRAYRNLFFVIGIFCLVTLCFACHKKGDESKSQKESNEFVSKMLEHWAKPDQEIVALLALKYNKPLDIVENVVDIYLTDTSLEYNQIKSTYREKDLRETKKPHGINLELLTLDKSAYADKVVKISNQFSLEPAIVASILLDYRTWKAAESPTGPE